MLSCNCEGLSCCVFSSVWSLFFCLATSYLDLLCFSGLNCHAPVIFLVLCMLTHFSPSIKFNFHLSLYNSCTNMMQDYFRNKGSTKSLWEMHFVSLSRASSVSVSCLKHHFCATSQLRDILDIFGAKLKSLSMYKHLTINLWCNSWF